MVIILQAFFHISWDRLLDHFETAEAFLLQVYDISFNILPNRISSLNAF